MKKTVKILLVLCCISLLGFAGCWNEKKPENNHKHAWILQNTIASDCENAGKEVYTCDCGEEKEELIPAKGHTWEYESAIEPDCVNAGKEIYTCVCGGVKETPISAVGHQMVDGTCEVCGLSVSQGLTYALSRDKTYYILTDIGECEDTHLILPTEYENLPIKEISDRAFEDNTEIESVEIHGNIEKLDYSAFENCTSLKTVILKEGLVIIGQEAFKGCTSLETIEIPSSVQAIKNGAFMNCESLQTVTFNEGLETIGHSAFCNTAIEELKLPNSLKTIEEAGTFRGTFQGCKNLKTVDLGGVETIGNYAFRYCESLESVTMNSVKTIGGDAFNGCTLLKTISLNEGIELIKYESFANCTSLAAIEIPSSVQTIEFGAFKNCESLQTVTFNEGLEIIGGSAFYNTALKFIHLPTSVQSIGDEAFKRCAKLTNVLIESANLTEVGASVFNDCEELKRLYYKGKPEDWAKVTVGWNGNNVLVRAPYCYSETQPQTAGDYWYYNDNNEKKIWNLSYNPVFQAQAYVEGFANSAFTSESASYSNLLIQSMDSDEGMCKARRDWEKAHLLTDPSSITDQVGKITKQGLYELALFDVLTNKIQGDGTDAFELFSDGAVGFGLDAAKYILGEDVEVTEKALKAMNADAALVRNTNFFKGFEALEGVFNMYDNLFGALTACARYQAMQNLSDGYREVLLQISKTASDSYMRMAAAKCADQIGEACAKTMEEILLGTFAEKTAENVIEFAVDLFWDKVVVAACPAIAIGLLAAKGVLLLADGAFNLSAVNGAYYQLYAAVQVENAIRDVVNGKQEDYLHSTNKDKANVYMHAIEMYRRSVLLGFDYTKILLTEQMKSLTVSAEERAKYRELLVFCEEKKAEKQGIYNQFEQDVVKKAYESYYSEG